MPHQPQTQNLDFQEFSSVSDFSDSEVNRCVLSELEKLRTSIKTHALCDLRQTERTSSPNGQRTRTILQRNIWHDDY